MHRRTLIDSVGALVGQAGAHGEAYVSGSGNTLGKDEQKDGEGKSDHTANKCCARLAAYRHQQNDQE